MKCYVNDGILVLLTNKHDEILQIKLDDEEVKIIKQKDKDCDVIL